MQQIILFFFLSFEKFFYIAIFFLKEKEKRGEKEIKKRKAMLKKYIQMQY